MGIELRASMKRVWTIIWLGPLLGGLPFNLLIVTVPISYAIGIFPAVLTACCAEIWFIQRSAQGLPPSRWQIRFAGALIGSLTCFFAASVGYLLFNKTGTGLLMTNDFSSTLIFTALGGFWSAVLLPGIYGQFEIKDAEQEKLSLLTSTH